MADRDRFDIVVMFGGIATALDAGIQLANLAKLIESCEAKHEFDGQLLTSEDFLDLIRQASESNAKLEFVIENVSGNADYEDVINSIAGIGFAGEMRTLDDDNNTAEVIVVGPGIAPGPDGKSQFKFRGESPSLSLHQLRKMPGFNAEHPEKAMTDWYRRAILAVKPIPALNVDETLLDSAPSP